MCVDRPTSCGWQAAPAGVGTGTIVDVREIVVLCEREEWSEAFGQPGCTLIN